MSRRGYVRAARVCGVYAALVSTYLILFLPFPPQRGDHLRAFVTLALLCAGSVFVVWSVGTRPRVAPYVQGVLAAYGALMVIRIPLIAAQITDGGLTPAVVLSYALATSIGVAQLLGFAAVWVVDRIDRRGASSPPVLGA